MKAAVVVLFVSVLLLATSSFGESSWRHARGFRHRSGSSSLHKAASGRTGTRTVGTRSSDRFRNLNRQNSATYGFVLTPGREIKSTPASWGWMWVDGPSPETLKQQKARDDAFQSALEQYQKDFPWRLMPWEK